MARNIAILTYGPQHDQCANIDYEVESMKDALPPNTIVDLALPTDYEVPFSYDDWHKDGTNNGVIMKVFGDERFAEWVTSDIDDVAAVDDIQIIIMADGDGYHRADVFARTMEAAMNCLDSPNGRLFNAKHFPLVHTSSKAEVVEQCQAAHRWAINAWYVNKTPNNPSLIYAHEATSNREGTCAAWLQIFDHIDAKNAEAFADTEQAPEPEPASKKRKSLKAVGAAKMVKSALRATPKAMTPKPPLPPPRPVESESSGSAAWRYAKNFESWDDESKSAWGEDRSWGASKSDWGDDRKWSGDDTADHDDGKDKSDRAEDKAWQTLKFDVKSWVPTLIEHGVDEWAQKELFLLAQLGEAGAQQANSIISKIIKKHLDGVTLRKPGAFVHAAVQSARSSILEKTF